MPKALVHILLGVVVSFFVFPVQFTIYPALNTKMMLAVLGLFFFVVKAIRGDGAKVHSDIIISALISLVFSFMCFLPAARFGTGDDSYSSYYQSFLVWIFAAYAVCFFLKLEYGRASVKTIVYYLAAVCVFQCFASQVIDRVPSVQSAVDRVFEQGQSFLHNINRLYGIGASLDSGGVRFAFTLLLMSYFISDSKKITQAELIFLSVSFVVITVFGSMIARTSTAGAVMGLGYLVWHGLKRSGIFVKISTLKSLLTILVIVAISIFAFNQLYVSDYEMKSQLRFAFEGFFNWVETGSFTADSLEKLNNTMWIWPKNLQTWLWGTGKFGNWVFGTDIGYCRFILYCGLVGFSVFVWFFIHNTLAVNRKFEDFSMMSFLLLVLVFVVWMKVSTDIFQIYALLLCADRVWDEVPEPDEK